MMNGHSFSSLAIDLQTTPPGTVRFEASSEHVIRIHAGEPVRGECNTQKFVFQRGDLDLFPAGTADSWYETSSSTFLTLRLPPLLIARAAEDLGRISDASLEPRYHFRDAQIEHIVWALDAERRAGFPSSSVYTDGLGLALAVRLLGFRAPDPINRGGLSGAHVRRITRYIDENLDRDLSLEQLAGVAGISISHLKTSFRRAVGVPVHRYVIQRRVEHARLLLQKGERPISQIALEAGFAHQSHLARWMRRMLGVSPTSVSRSSLR